MFLLILSCWRFQKIGFPHLQSFWDLHCLHLVVSIEHRAGPTSWACRCRRSCNPWMPQWQSVTLAPKICSLTSEMLTSSFASDSRKICGIQTSLPLVSRSLMCLWSRCGTHVWLPRAMNIHSFALAISWFHSHAMKGLEGTFNISGASSIHCKHLRFGLMIRSLPPLERQSMFVAALSFSKCLAC